MWDAVLNMYNVISITLSNCNYHIYIYHIYHILKLPRDSFIQYYHSYLSMIYTILVVSPYQMPRDSLN